MLKDRQGIEMLEFVVLAGIVVVAVIPAIVSVLVAIRNQLNAVAAAIP